MIARTSRDILYARGVVRWIDISGPKKSQLNTDWCVQPTGRMAQARRGDTHRESLIKVVVDSSWWLSVRQLMLMAILSSWVGE
jgi:hypothetical protein